MLPSKDQGLRNPFHHINSSVEDIVRQDPRQPEEYNSPVFYNAAERIINGIENQQLQANITLDAIAKVRRDREEFRAKEDDYLRQYEHEMIDIVYATSNIIDMIEQGNTPINLRVV